MKLKKISALAELISAIAIVVTLAYLALETHQNTIAVQATIRQSMLAEDRELVFKQMDYPFVAPWLYGSRQLTDVEKTQLASWLIVFIRGRENQWLQYRAGVIDEITWESYRYPLRDILLREPAKTFWRTHSSRGEFAHGFGEDVDQFLADAPAPADLSFDQLIGFSE